MIDRICQKRPSFYVRLSGLIVVQVLFVFAALALLIFYPVDQSPVVTSLEDNQDLVNDLSVLIDDNVVAGSQTIAGPFSDKDRQRLRQELARLESFHCVHVYSMGEGKTVKTAFAFDLESFDPNCSHSLQPFERELIDTGLIRYVADRPVQHTTSTMISERHSVHYHRLADVGKMPTVVVAVVENDLLISDRSSLMYVCFVLFLVATLVSLLTVYLIRYRVKEPLSRLIRGLEKTTNGELYYLIETDGTREVDQLVTAFNRMTSTLWENRKKLKAYNADLKKINLSLLQSQLFLSALIDNSPSAIVAVSPSGQIMLFNQVASEVFGYSNAEAVGKQASELFALPHGESDVDLACAEEEAGWEARCRRSDGTSFPAYVISSSVTDRGDTMAQLYQIRDITESQGFLDMMIRLDRYYTRGEMVGDIAHEINNYLAILGGNVELIPLILRKGQHEKLEKKLHLMKDTVDKIARFTDGLMDTPQNRADLEKRDLNQLVENVMAFLKPQNRFDPITVEVSLSSELPLVAFDAGQMQQLLTNYMFNAVDAVMENEGDKIIRIATSVVAVDDSGCARLEVHDNGSGVSEENRPKLFEQRFTTKKKGHGIGLVTCRRIIDGHHGEVGYEFDNGARFYCDLPLVPVAAEAADGATKSAEAPIEQT